ncbi:MAG: restriction endonuclease family protein [Betaproteobacteria bacterium]|nr:restriction endonuclease family protein [Betaproteobacteria bacterium]
MAIWIIRAGAHGEFEQKFIQENRVYVTWDSLDVDLGKLDSREDLFSAMGGIYEDAKPKRLHNWVSQVWPFAHVIKKGDLVVLPLKTQPAICIGEIAGDYQYDLIGPNPFYHWRKVKWIADAVPRSHFGQDLLFTFGAFLTICRVQRNNAEARINAMRSNGWKPEKGARSIIEASGSVDVTAENTDLEEAARDQIAQLVTAKFKGHGLERLVEGVLKAQGYTTYRSPEGADGGVDILAGAGPLGFGSPRLCVQVKSQDTPVESKILNELRGAMQTVSATEGLLVSWGGFKSSIYKQVSTSFFSVRLWTQKELLEALFANYERLDPDLKAELPLKRIWTIAAQEEE